jgi:adenosylhomocysteine nucleosidase
LYHTVAVTAAMEREISFLRSAITPPDHTGARFVVGTFKSKAVLILRTGVGPLKTVRRLPELTKAHCPQCVISIGCAGALHPDMGVGDVVIADSLVDDADGGQTYHPSTSLIETAKNCCKKLRIPSHTGRTVSTAIVAATPEDKIRLAGKHGAIAVDMESAQVAAWAENCRIPMLSIRTISDSSADRIPPELASVVDQTGKILLPKAARLFIRRPGLLLNLIQLKSKFDISFGNLEKAVMTLLEEL